MAGTNSGRPGGGTAGGGRGKKPKHIVTGPSKPKQTVTGPNTSKQIKNAPTPNPPRRGASGVASSVPRGRKRT